MALKLVIITASQKGANRTALDWAIKCEFPHGGWCPVGCLTEDDAPLPYKLKETPTENVLESVEYNVRDSDATLVLTLGPKTAGAAQKAVSYAKKQKKPILHLHRGLLGVSEKIVGFLDKYYVRRLHLTGSSEADEAGISAWMSAELDKAKSILDRRPD